MGLSCSCDQEWDGEGVAAYSPTDFTKLETKRRRRCCSCNQLIDVGASCLEFRRVRLAQDEIEERIYGDDNEISLASKYMCEDCGEIFLNLEDLGYCVDYTECMSAALAEYWEITGFRPEKQTA
ncbi:MAG TPA: hypothetical protein DHV36_09525 [Desulfobacteraceae bacterium]|nr:hypothetical protein [Desulfobacteraceae bacterium]|tara:strand:+ start:175 stop:546 length:372 start_codon:yes stop_codon:yes gene_type:complete